MFSNLGLSKLRIVPLSKNMMEYLVMAIEQCSKPENIQMLVEKRDSPFMDSDVTQLNL